jgi:hypothetical protein
MLFGQFEENGRRQFIEFGGRFCTIGRFFLCWEDEKPESFREPTIRK